MKEGANIHLSPIDGKRLCSFSQKICKQHRLNGYAFCIRHILEDKDAPFKQCQYTMKSTREKCFNPVPILAERIYCNNHLQVLGLLPVKSKSATSSKGKNHKIFNSTSKIKLAKKLSNAKKLNHKKSQLILLNKKMKNKTLAKVSGKSTGHQKNDCIKNLQKARKKFHEVVTKNLSQWMEDMEKKKNLFYLSRDFNRNIHNNKCGIHVMNDDVKPINGNHGVYQTSLLVAPERVHHTDLHVDSTGMQERKVLTKLKHQHSQLEQIIREKQESGRLSYSVLSKLIASVKEDVIHTSTVLNIEKDPACSRLLRPHGEKKMYQIPCSITFKSSKCKNKALPYTRFCRKRIFFSYILEDPHQLIYFKSNQNKQASPAFTNGLTYSFMCTQQPPKKKSDHSAASKNKQKHSDISSVSDSDKPIDDERADNSDTSESESDSENDILTPEEGFRVPQGTLSKFNLQSDEDSFTRLQNSNMNYEDDDELMQCRNQFQFDSTSLSRDISSSPTLNQLSSSGFDHSFKMFLSPTKNTSSQPVISPLTTSFFSSFERNEEHKSKSDSDNGQNRCGKETPFKATPFKHRDNSKSPGINQDGQQNSDDLITPRISNLFNSSNNSIRKSFNPEPLFTQSDIANTTFDNIETDVGEISLEKVNPDIYFSSAFQPPGKQTLEPQ